MRIPKTMRKNTHALRSINCHKKTKVKLSGLTQGLSTPSLKGIGREPKF
jgi:hypothetical protein